MRYKGMVIRMVKRNDNPLGRILREMIPGLLILTVSAFLISLFWGFRLSVLIGFCIGFAYAVLSHYYLAETIIRAVDLSKKQAQRMMLRCYLLRYSVLILICFAAYATEIINVFSALVPQLFPRFILMFINYRERKAVFNDTSAADK